MPPLTKIADLDRRWFQHRPGRSYRARYATPAEHQAFGGDPDLVLLIRSLGRGLLLHQPVMLSAPPPADEGRIAALFARAAADPLPVPILREPELSIEGAEIVEPAG